MKKAFTSFLFSLLFTSLFSQWQRVGLDTSRIETLNHENNILYASDDYEVYNSLNNGNTWNAIDPGFYQKTISSIKSSNGNIFVSVNNFNISPFSEDGVKISSDNGLTWSFINNGLPSGFEYFGDIEVNGSNIYIGTSQGLFTSTNNGLNWVSINGNLSNLNIESLKIDGNNIYIGTTSNGIFLSSNNGTTWISLNNIGLTTSRIYSIEKIGANLILGTDDGVFTSTNNGTSWVQTGMIGLTVNNIKAVNLDVFATIENNSGASIFKSSNNGISWSGISSGTINNLTVYDLISIGQNLYSVTSNGVYLSTDNGYNWSFIGLNNVGSLGVNGNDLIVGSSFDGGGLFSSSNNGINWNTLDPGLPGKVISLELNGSDIFAGLQYAPGGIFKSSSNNWNKLNTSNFAIQWVNALKVNNNLIFAGTYYGMMISIDNGTTWSAINNGFPYNFGNYVIINSIEINGNQVYVATNNGVYVSSDNGSNWILISANLPTQNATSIAFNGSSIFVGTASGGMFSSTDNGNNWTPINNNIPNNSGVYYQVEDIFIDNTVMYIATKGSGILNSLDGGANWTSMNLGLATNIDVTSIIKFNNEIYIGTEGGVWKWTSPILENLNVDKDKLFKLFPNPVDDYLNITLQSNQTEGNIKMMDVIGNVILDEKIYGIKKLNFDSFKNGVYLISLTLNGVIATQRIVVNH